MAPNKKTQWTDLTVILLANEITKKKTMEQGQMCNIEIYTLMWKLEIDKCRQEFSKATHT